MRITKFEHACFVASIGDKKVVVDPGSFTVPLPDSNNVVAVVITHEHADHWTPEHLQRIKDNSPDVRFFGPAGVVGSSIRLRVSPSSRTATRSRSSRSPSSSSARSTPRSTSRSRSSTTSASSSTTPCSTRGDSFTLGPVGVDLLGVPASAPWLKIGEVMDYVLAPEARSAASPPHDMINSVARQPDGRAHASPRQPSRTAASSYHSRSASQSRSSQSPDDHDHARGARAAKSLACSVLGDPARAGRHGRSSCWSLATSATCPRCSRS